MPTFLVVRNALYGKLTRFTAFFWGGGRRLVAWQRGVCEGVREVRVAEARPVVPRETLVSAGAGKEQHIRRVR